METKRTGRFGTPENPHKRGAEHPSFKHGLSNTREYKAWNHALDRCFSPRVHNYYRYGGRGITMCEAWRKSFETFLCDMGPCPPGLTLERKNSNGDYEPGNCEWATRLKQARNQDRVVYLTANGKTQTASEWSIELGISSRRIRKRLQSGMSDERALSPVKLTPSGIPLRRFGIEDNPCAIKQRRYDL